MKSTDFRKQSMILELERFTDHGIKMFTQACIEDFPSYFWTAPASGTGLWHDEEENLPGGLVLHVRRLLRLLEDLGHFYGLSFYEMDILYSAAFLHDSWCKGTDPYTDNTSTDVFHPLFPRRKFEFLSYGEGKIDQRTYEEIMVVVESHSGRWSVSPSLWVDKKLPRLFSLADYVASRKTVKIEVK